MNFKKCSSCSQEKEIILFHKNKSKKDGFSSLCKDCYKLSFNKNKISHYENMKEYKIKNNSKITKYKRDWHFQNKYGITLADLDNLRTKQNFSCAICKKHELLTPRKSLCVDHCHTTGKVRGLLCESCNQALGLLYDNKESLINALEYLNK